MAAKKKTNEKKTAPKPQDFDKTILDIDLRAGAAAVDLDKTVFFDENKPSATPPQGVASTSPASPKEKRKPQDLDKTALDIDIRSLTRGFEETLMVNNPPVDHTLQIHVDDLEQDLDKTSLDIDVRKFNKGFDETLMIYLPKNGVEDEDIDDFFDEDEHTGDYQASEPSISQNLFDPDLADENPNDADFDISDSELEALSEPILPQPLPDYQPALTHAHPTSISIWYLSLSSVLLFIMVISTIETLVRHSPLALLGVLISALGVIPILGIILKHWTGRTGFLILIAMAFSEIVFAAYRLPTSDPLTFHLIKLPLGAYVGPILMGLGLLITGFLWRKPGVPLFSKLVSLAASGLLLLALLFTLAEWQNLEATIWNSRYLIGLPIYLRPGFLALSLSFVLYFWSLFVALLFVKQAYRTRFYSWAIPSLLISVLGISFGIKLLLR